MAATGALTLASTLLRLDATSRNGECHLFFIFVEDCVCLRFTTLALELASIFLIYYVAAGWHLAAFIVTHSRLLPLYFELRIVFNYSAFIFDSRAETALDFDALSFDSFNLLVFGVLTDIMLLSFEVNGTGASSLGLQLELTLPKIEAEEVDLIGGGVLRIVSRFDHLVVRRIDLRDAGIRITKCGHVLRRRWPCLTMPRGDELQRRLIVAILLLFLQPRRLLHVLRDPLIKHVELVVFAQLQVFAGVAIDQNALLLSFCVLCWLPVAATGFVRFLGEHLLLQLRESRPRKILLHLEGREAALCIQASSRECCTLRWLPPFVLSLHFP